VRLLASIADMTIVDNQVIAHGATDMSASLPPALSGDRSTSITKLFELAACADQQSHPADIRGQHPEALQQGRVCSLMPVLSLPGSESLAEQPADGRPGANLTGCSTFTSLPEQLGQAVSAGHRFTQWVDFDNQVMTLGVGIDINRASLIGGRGVLTEREG
jgi:hypothetical protein